jgi:senataxin
VTNGLSAQTRGAVITPYAQQANLLRRVFGEALGQDYGKLVEINTVDGFQGREANILIISCVRAAGSHGVAGFLSDVPRINVALTRAKFFLCVIAPCDSVVMNPY